MESNIGCFVGRRLLNFASTDPLAREAVSWTTRHRILKKRKRKEDAIAADVTFFHVDPESADYESDSHQQLETETLTCSCDNSPEMYHYDDPDYDQQLATS